MEKIIHYCWFGKKKKPERVQRCIQSWKEYCPGWQIIEWNEENTDLSSHPYVRYCFEHQKWAYLSDYIRLQVVERSGGVYLDTDVQLLRPLDELTGIEAWFSWEDSCHINTGLGFGCEKHHPVLQKLMDSYDHFSEQNPLLLNCPVLNTEVFLSLGFQPDGTSQNRNGILIFSPEYFNPYNPVNRSLNITEKTLAIHWYSRSAWPWYIRIRAEILSYIRVVFGENFLNRRAREGTGKLF